MKLMYDIEVESTDLDYYEVFSGEDHTVILGKLIRRLSRVVRKGTCTKLDKEDKSEITKAVDSYFKRDNHILGDTVYKVVSIFDGGVNIRLFLSVFEVTEEIQEKIDNEDLFSLIICLEDVYYTFDNLHFSNIDKTAQEVYSCDMVSKRVWKKIEKFIKHVSKNGEMFDKTLLNSYTTKFSDKDLEQDVIATIVIGKPNE
jgi:hypothetical protein